ncbi:GTP pyrophosphokinase [Humidisolicoccus flavus]|uniref:GTP pyrophosphokinase n=1 Tax=Humidisolicoccus flavus TaxID=3111414 RepID=UPI00325408AF
MSETGREHQEVEQTTQLFGELLRRLNGDPLETEGAPRLEEELKNLQQTLVRFRQLYKFAIDEVLTKINILREEFENTNDYSPIEHVNSRMKSMESLLSKVVRTDCPPDLDSVRDRIRDIAGIRVTCSFEADVYRIAEILSNQPDITVVEIKDYVKAPKPNGYKSLHLIVQIPVFLSTGSELVYVEIQIRTIAMDFWASLEHKIYYKFDRDVPAEILAELKNAADTAHELDQRMARLRAQVNDLPESPTLYSA